MHVDVCMVVLQLHTCAEDEYTYMCICLPCALCVHVCVHVCAPHACEVRNWLSSRIILNIEHFTYSQVSFYLHTRNGCILCANIGTVGYSHLCRYKAPSCWMCASQGMVTCVHHGQGKE